MATPGGRILALGRTQKAGILTLAPLALALCALATLFPQSGDDWAWGSPEGIERLHERFAGYNGRYLGNIAVLVLTRATWFTPFVVAVTVCLIVWLLVAIAGIRTPTGYLLGSALVVGMPLTYWRETVVWVSGFANYTLACVGLIVFVLTVKRDWTQPQPWRVPIALAIPLGLFAAAAQLFMEHVTLLLLVASLVNVVVQLRVRHKVSEVAVAWAVGAVIGAVIMFSNSAYRLAAQGEARYQGAAGGDGDTSRLRAIIEQGTGGVSQFAVTGNLVLNMTLFVIMLGLAWRGSQGSGRVDRWAVSAVALAGIALVGGAVVNGSVQPGFYFAGLSAWAWVPALSLLAALLLSAWRLVESSERRLTVALLTASVLFLTVPFAVVTPYGPRTFLPGYLLMVAVALVLLADLLDSLLPPLLPLVLAGTAAAVVAVGLAGYFSVYATIDHAAYGRIEKVRAAANDGRRVVKIFTLPFPTYVQNPDPYEGALSKRFKRYYDLPPTLEIQLFDRYPNPFLPSSDTK